MGECCCAEFCSAAAANLRPSVEREKKAKTTKICE